MNHLILSIRALPLLLSILVSSLLVQTAYSIKDFNLYHICPNTSKTYKNDTPFDTNLDKLLNLINSTTPSKNEHGFWKGSSGTSPDEAFGMGLCRGDVSNTTCRKCIINATRDIAIDCHHSKAAIVWRDFCSVKYSNYSFFGQIDTRNKVYMWNTANATDPVKFNSTAIELLRELSKNASDSEYMFARGEASFNNVTIYAMGQCSRDITRGNCKICLDCAVNELPGIVSVNGTLKSIPVGGRTITGTCNVRYEKYRFLKD
ncbi:hypothetical protein CASFOL_040914 [Castilleja foliolosa]|uniref:Gnk2-homologous domain-containing protein n=1 Tax=Castilleja foliolosa TaxID=1961234 RepID=A0ABD3BCZ4_9LAMI